MTLIKSISGIRGTIGGKTNEALTPLDIVKFTSAFGARIILRGDNKKVVIGRDARPSGPMITDLVSSTLQGLGMDVINLGLSTTPTVEIAVPLEKAGGGIIITASHNPEQWNALKLLNHQGEFISAKDGAELLTIAASDSIEYAPIESLGKVETRDDYLQIHIDKILELPWVNQDAIAQARFKIALDAVKSSGEIAVPMLLEALGVSTISSIYGEPNGIFPHNPEPLPENIKQICKEVGEGDFDLGIVVDPDVDRLALVCEDGAPFGEEYTIVAVADYLLNKQPGNTVSNLSSSRALKDVTERHGGKYFASAVGEVNVVRKMKEVDALIGGEGNGGVILPALHYGRDALVGIALILSHLAVSGMSLSKLRKQYPNYVISKNKIELNPELDIDMILTRIQERYQEYPINTEDGVKIEFENEWIHLRKSNTEPIIRIYAESQNEVQANKLANEIIDNINNITAYKV
ncbi:MAG: phosphoglucosamine mutase [Bacteroidetes bacterium]|nr:phosphoglucosamine mutase [Bacteroidota bacterium]